MPLDDCERESGTVVAHDNESEYSRLPLFCLWLREYEKKVDAVFERREK